MLICRDVKNPALSSAITPSYVYLLDFPFFIQISIETVVLNLFDITLDSRLWFQLRINTNEEITHWK